MAAKILGLDVEALRDTVFSRLLLLPDMLLQPRHTYKAKFERDAPLAEAIPFAAMMFVLGAASAAALPLSGSVEVSSVAYITVGTVTVWMLYAMFLHAFAFMFGGRTGAKRTIAAYLYVIGSLQPVFVMMLWMLTWVVPDSVTYRTLSGGFGGSGIAIGLAGTVSGRFFTPDTVALYRVASGILILVYFAIALRYAQRIGPVRAALASFASLVFFVVLYAIIILAGAILGLDPVVRLLLQ